MNELTTLDPRDLYHAPQLMAETVHRIEKVIEAAAALERWEDLEKAIDFLVECQKEILRWWKDHVQGEGRPSKKLSRDPAIVSVEAAKAKIGFSDDRLSRWRKAHANLDTYRENVATAARRKAELEAAANHRAEGTGENEWFTPAEYVEAAREVMGGIDLDPATHEAAQRTVQAVQYYTKQDDGLRLAWHGRVWLNPPYAQPYIAQFVDKLASEFSAGAVEQAVLLTHNYTDTTWFHRAAGAASLICFTRGRIRFVDVDGGLCAPTQGQAFCYFGGSTAEFIRAFSRFGFVVAPCR
jgi:phage N-6-adenine-methyltransferase